VGHGAAMASPSRCARIGRRCSSQIPIVKATVTLPEAINLLNILVLWAVMRDSRRRRLGFRLIPALTRKASPNLTVYRVEMPRSCVRKAAKYDLKRPLATCKTSRVGSLSCWSWSDRHLPAFSCDPFLATEVHHGGRARQTSASGLSDTKASHGRELCAKGSGAGRSQ
jgi:hypothetical protein